MMLKVSRATWVWYLRLAFAVREKDESCTLIDVPLYVYGEILPQRGKKWRKTDISVFEHNRFDNYTWQNNHIITCYPRRIKEKKTKEPNKKKGRIALSVFLARTCSAHTFQQQCCFFAVTSVTPKEEKQVKGRNSLQDAEEKSEIFVGTSSEIWRHESLYC